LLALVVGLLAVSPQVQVGLERIEADKGGALRARRVGLVAHAASVTADGRHAIEVLRSIGVDVRRLFGPEHGLRSRAAAGEKVASGTDPESGLPLVSLYGTSTKPDPKDLRDIDALVIDLQDAGVRFYTYASTMILCLEAAAEAGIDLVVLDRPNPLGGELMEGPLRDPASPSSLVSLAPGPLVHGLTLGEMARMVNGGLAKPARLTVVPVSGWRREMVWADTARTWVPPSPNLRTADAALAYPGVCLLEATNVSEGRGTGAPFLLLGAPWLRPEETARAVRADGFRLDPAAFTPAASPAAPAPKLAGESCRGLRVQVTDAHAVRPYALGLGLLRAIRLLHPEFRWTREGAGLDTLLGTRRVREALERDESVDSILAADEPALTAFARERKAALLY
jgi:uncharacterized protein YbbC (DUF1343 family)